MTRFLALAAFLLPIALSAAPADARPRRVEDRPRPVAAELAPGAATRARDAKVAGFSARMIRLDALMGAPATPPARSRSANAEH